MTTRFTENQHIYQFPKTQTPENRSETKKMENFEESAPEPGLGELPVAARVVAGDVRGLANPSRRSDGHGRDIDGPIGLRKA